jgi:hypothetical protein
LLVWVILDEAARAAADEEGEISAGEPGRAASGGFVKELPPEIAAMLKPQAEDQRRISIRDANLFHHHFIDTCMEAMPREVTVGYGGLLARGIKTGQV